jgi:GT2 family glycosyltransferase
MTRRRPPHAGTEQVLHKIGVIIVTRNNSSTVGQLVVELMAELADLRSQVIVVDNASVDRTMEMVASIPGVTGVSASGYVGYAGAINVGLRLLDDDVTAVAILSPHMRPRPGAVRALLDRLDGQAAAVAVPRILGSSGETYTTLYREPSIARAVGDAVFGGRLLRGRPSWLSKIDFAAEGYAYAHPVDWATGAVLVVRRDVADSVGPWDEQFFLYSEDTDFMRRVRELDGEVWYEPSALVESTCGASNESSDDYALLAINAVRYVRKYRSSMYAALYRLVVIGHYLLRSRDPAKRRVLRCLLDESTWPQLPGATVHPSSFRGGAVIIPAHNEATVIDGSSTSSPRSPPPAASRSSSRAMVAPMAPRRSPSNTLPSRSSAWPSRRSQRP